MSQPRVLYWWDLDDDNDPDEVEIRIFYDDYSVCIYNGCVEMESYYIANSLSVLDERDYTIKSHLDARWMELDDLPV